MSNHPGLTPNALAEAVRANDLARVASLLDARPELVNMEMSYGDERRAIHFAVMNRQPEMVRVLMQRGANPHTGIYPHRKALTAINIARERGFDEIVAIIEAEERPQAEPVSEQAPAEPADPAREAIARGDAEWLRARHPEGKLENR